MFNKYFKQEWKTWNGTISLFTTDHLEIGIDKDYIGICFEISPSYREIYIKLFNIAFTIF